MSLAELYAQFRATDPVQWPDALKPHAWAWPDLSLPLCQTETGTFDFDADLPINAPRDFFPKLAIKSWRDSGRLRMVPRGAPFRNTLKGLLMSPTQQQRLVLEAWFTDGATPFLHLYPWRPTHRTTEARYLAGPEGVRRLSSCYRDNAPADFAAAQALAVEVRDLMGLKSSLVLQLAYAPDGSPKVVDINPALSRPHLRLLEEEGAIAG